MRIRRMDHPGRSARAGICPVGPLCPQGDRPSGRGGLLWPASYRVDTGGPRTRRCPVPPAGPPRAPPQSQAPGALSDPGAARAAGTSVEKGLANRGPGGIVCPYALVGQELHANRTSEHRWVKRHSDTAAGRWGRRLHLESMVSDARGGSNRWELILPLIGPLT